MDEESKSSLKYLLHNSKIASLGTCNENQPYVSMVAFSTSSDFSEFYIHISELAIHTKNILSNKHVSLMICESENEANNPQTLARISILGKANIIGKNDIYFEEVKNNYVNKNPFTEMYFNLADFQLFRIIVDKARFVAGFAKTFNLTKATLKKLQE